MAKKNKLKWRFSKGDHISADLSISGDYVISHRPEEFTLSYRPPKQHVPLGFSKTLDEAKAKAQTHHDQL